MSLKREVLDLEQFVLHSGLFGQDRLTDYVYEASPVRRLPQEEDEQDWTVQLYEREEDARTH